MTAKSIAAGTFDCPVCEERVIFTSDVNAYTTNEGRVALTFSTPKTLIDGHAEDCSAAYWRGADDSPTS